MNKDIMKAAGFGEEVSLVEQGICPFCKKYINYADFIDECSRKEYKISGLCQNCQDGVFGGLGEKVREKEKIVIGENDFLVADVHVDRQTHPGKYKKYVGTSGRVWTVGICDAPAEEIHVSAGQGENTKGYAGFRGYGGSTLKFLLDTGETLELTGPWHSNADSLFADTGIDVRDKYYTWGIIAKDRSYVGSMRLIMRDVLYRDAAPVLGDFDRVTKIAMQMAKERNEAVCCYEETKGGSSCGFVHPDQIDVHGNRPKKPKEVLTAYENPTKSKEIG